MTPPISAALGGYLSRQGPATLRWALFEAAHNASRCGSPDHAYYTTVKDRHDGKLAAISVARQFARRSYHLLATWIPNWSTPCPDRRRRRRPGTLTSTSGLYPRSAPAGRVPASLRAGRPYNNDATVLSTGDIQIPIVVADDMIIVEHPGNAERPHAAANRPTTSPHRPGLVKVTRLRFDCARCTLANTRGAAHDAKKALTDETTQVTRVLEARRPRPQPPVRRLIARCGPFRSVRCRGGG